MTRKDFDIFEQDMTQTIYENYLGILGVMEIKVASQPRADRVIPLIEKGISQVKEFWDWSKIGNDMILGWF